MLVAIFGLLPGLIGVSTVIEVILLSIAYALTLFGIGKVQGIGVLPVFNKYTDGFIVGFVLLWFALGAVHGFVGAANLFVLLRYVILAYLVAKYLSIKDIERISWIIFLLGISQIVIGCLQMAGVLPWVMTDVLLVKEGLYGVFKDNISYAAILLVAMIVYVEILNKASSFRTVVVSLLFICFIFLSESRAFFLLGFVYFLVAVLKVRMSVLLIAVGGGAALLVASGLGLGESNQDFLFFLSDAYINMAMHQRLGLLVELLPQFITSPNIFFGFGSDKDLAVDQIIYSYNFYFIFTDDLPVIIEDVYWLTMLIYYGIIGTFFFLFYIIGVYCTGRKIQRLTGGNAGVVNAFIWLFFLALALGMTGQVFEVKAYSLFFWIYVGALAVVRRELYERTSN